MKSLVFLLMFRFYICILYFLFHIYSPFSGASVSLGTTVGQQSFDSLFVGVACVRKVVLGRFQYRPTSQLAKGERSSFVNVAHLSFFSLLKSETYVHFYV